MSTNVRCPHCSTVLRVPATQTGATFRCPKCSQTIRLGTPPQNAPTSRTPSGSLAAGAPSAGAPSAGAPSAGAPSVSQHQPFAAQGGYPAGSVPAGMASPYGAPAGSRSVANDAVSLRPFLIRWAIVLGIGTVLLLGLGLAGLAAEPIALAATVAMVVAMIACLLVGQIWMAIAAGQKNVLIGVAAFFVPMVGLVLAVVHKGRVLCGAIIYVSCLVPAVLGLIFLSVYKTRYTAAGRTTARTARLADDQLQLESMIRSAEQRVAADAPVVTANFRYVQIGPQSPLSTAEGEAILSPFQHYVNGSFQVDEQAKTVRFDYRGPPSLATKYRLLLYNRTQVMLTEVPAG